MCSLAFVIVVIAFSLGAMLPLLAHKDEYIVEIGLEIMTNCRRGHT